jgi:GT2 family glycosyltransferase
VLFKQVNSEKDIKISIIIVHYKVPECLHEAIHSIYQAELSGNTEIIVVDNASGDNSSQITKKEFPDVIWIQLKQNIGFGKACNIGARHAKGCYILLLNPDTVISKTSLSIAYTLLESRSDIGLMGPKILNPDGTLQASCRRSFPTPAVAIFYFTGLSKLFPKSKLLSRYHMTFMDQDQAGELEAISGSFMFLRRNLFNEIGGFDEIFFMYGEDLDLCWRIREKGYKVWYEPATQIIHRKGRSSAKNAIRSRIAFYEAMVLFLKKYRFSGIFPTWFIFLGILLQASLNIGTILFKYSAAALMDLIFINSVVYMNILFRFKAENPYTQRTIIPLIGAHFLLSIIFITIYAYNGVYSKKRYTVSNTFFSSLFASLTFLSCIYFVKSMAFSRIAFAFSTVSITLVLIGWREIVPRVISRFKKILIPPERIIIAGAGVVSYKIIKNIENEKSGTITGIIWTDQTPPPPEYEGYPVLGKINDMAQILQRYKTDMLLIATIQPWYSYVIELLASKKVKNLTVKWVQQDIFKRSDENLPEKIPLLDFSI